MNKKTQVIKFSKIIILRKQNRTKSNLMFNICNLKD